jgi:hypothetical protein
MQTASTIPSTTSERTSNRKKTSTRACGSNAPEKGNVAFVAEPQLAVEGTHTYCTKNTIRGTVRDKLPVEKA